MLNCGISFVFIRRDVIVSRVVRVYLGIELDREQCNINKTPGIKNIPGVISIPNYVLSFSFYGSSLSCPLFLGWALL
jgi:hypothetical protein